MMNLNTLIFVLSLFFLVSLNQSHNPIKSNDLEEMAYSFKNGSSKDLSQYFGSRVEINISGNSGLYSKNQAEQVMRDFFKKYPPQNFVIVNRSGGNTEITSSIGNYFSTDTKFKVFLRVKSENDLLAIFALDIIKD